MTGTVPGHPGDRDGGQPLGRLRLENDPNVLASNPDGFFVDTRGFVVKLPHLADKANVAARTGFSRNAVDAVVPARRNGKVHQADIAVRRKYIYNAPRSWHRIAFWHVEGETVREQPAGVQHRDRTVPQRLRIQLAGSQTPRFEPEFRSCEPNRIFEIAALKLEVMRAEVHPLRPHHPRQKLHSRDLPDFIVCRTGSWSRNTLP
jgi:hypothetical protein